jgi:hypothetical protein
VNRMTFLDFRTGLDSVGGLRSVHHNVAKLKAAREVARQASGLPSLKSKGGAERRVDRRGARTAADGAAGRAMSFGATTKGPGGLK